MPSSETLREYGFNKISEQRDSHSFVCGIRLMVTLPSALCFPFLYLHLLPLWDAHAWGTAFSRKVMRGAAGQRFDSPLRGSATGLGRADPKPHGVRWPYRWALESKPSVVRPPCVSLEVGKWLVEVGKRPRGDPECPLGETEAGPGAPPWAAARTCARLPRAWGAHVTELGRSRAGGDHLNKAVM